MWVVERRLVLWVNRLRKDDGGANHSSADSANERVGSI